MDKRTTNLLQAQVDLSLPFPLTGLQRDSQWVKRAKQLSYQFISRKDFSDPDADKIPIVISLKDILSSLPALSLLITVTAEESWMWCSAALD